MAYQNMFPATYQPMYYPQYQQQQTQPVNNSIIWVQGEAGAKSYLVAPNTTVQLWDSENQVIYLKSSDASGMPSIKTLDYTIREMKQNSSAPIIKQDVEYATKDELDALRSKVESLIAKKGAEKSG